MDVVTTTGASPIITSTATASGPGPVPVGATGGSSMLDELRDICDERYKKYKTWHYFQDERLAAQDVNITRLLAALEGDQLAKFKSSSPGGGNDSTKDVIMTISNGDPSAEPHKRKRDENEGADMADDDDVQTPLQGLRDEINVKLKDIDDTLDALNAAINGHEEARDSDKAKMTQVR